MNISGTWKKSFVHENRWRPPVIRDNTLRLLKSRLLKNRRAWGHDDIHRTKSKVKYFLAWTKKTFFLSIGLDNGQEEKNMGTFIFFYSCLEWRTDYLWLQIQTCDPTRCDYLTFSILFLTSYFIVSKWWLIAEWNKSCFFSARKFRHQLNSQEVTFRSWCYALHFLTHVWRITSRDLNRTVFKMAFD